MRMLVEQSTAQPLARRRVELVERKGLGHPDTICDALAEAFSVALSSFYLERFGVIQHHNVDKALLIGGRARPAFGGGEVDDPIDIYLAGRATAELDGVTVPFEEIAIHACHEWFSTHLPELDARKHLRVHCRVRPGSRALVELFAREMAEGRPLANDTSCGVGFAPLTPLESAVLELERALNDEAVKRQHPEIGADIKVMGLRRDERIDMTLACAFVDRHVRDIEDYRVKTSAAAALAEQTSASTSGMPVSVMINTGDNLESGDVYLTVTGTSAEAGDDGEVGRGNRANGLITPLRPMTLEAAAGKNPITHVGKLYSLVAQRIADAAAGEVEVIDGVQCTLVSQIGAPIQAPWLVHLSVAAREDAPSTVYADALESIVDRELSALPGLWQGIMRGEFRIF